MEDDDYDIYGDLEGFEASGEKDSKAVQELHSQIDELRAEIAEKDALKQDIASKNAVLLENISSLLLTAKAELKRKDALMADIRRERDNAAFRRTKPAPPVQKHDQATQTWFNRTVDRGVQAVADSGGEDTARRHHERFRGKERDQERPRFRERTPREVVDLRSRLTARGKSRGRRDTQQSTTRQSTRLKERNRTWSSRSHEEERERDWRARRAGPRSPEVRFGSPVRIKAEHSNVPDSPSDVDFSQRFIPMNNRELDRYVKEIGRSQNRSPEVCADDRPKKGNKEGRAPKSDSRDRHVAKKKKSDKKTSTPVIKVEKRKRPSEKASIIQSDEIGTTGTSNSLSPIKTEELEQKMVALHGESQNVPPPPQGCPHTSLELLEALKREDEAAPPLPPNPPPESVMVPLPPPPEPPAERDDSSNLNDSLELKIVLPDEEAPTDEQNCSAETVIEKKIIPPALQNGESDELEDGEVVSPVGSPEHVHEEPLPKSEKEPETKEVGAIKLEKESPTKEVIPIAEVTEAVEAKQESLSPPAVTSEVKPNLHELLDQKSSGVATRRKTFSALVTNKTGDRKRLSEPSRVPAAAGDERNLRSRKTVTLKQLFGSDDENSLAGTPVKAEQTEVPMKRKLSPKKEESDAKRSRDEPPPVEHDGEETCKVETDLEVKPNGTTQISADEANNDSTLLDTSAKRRSGSHRTQVLKVEVNDEGETTVYVTRKKAKKSKKRTSLNETAGTNNC